MVQDHQKSQQILPPLKVAMFCEIYHWQFCMGKLIKRIQKWLLGITSPAAVDAMG